MASGGPVRALVVDDSAVVRSVLKKGLGEAEGLEVVGVAHNGRQALDMVASHKPEAVVLDVEMPEMTGIEFLQHLQPDKRNDLVVVMFSSASKDDAEVTMECLSLGAEEFVNKPDPCPTGMRQPLEETLDELAQTLRELVRARREQLAQRGGETSPGDPATPGGRVASGERLLAHFRPDLVVIGSSTGGPQVLHSILSGIPDAGTARIPVLMVQHIAQGFTAPFAERLSVRGPLEWREAREGEKVPLGTGLVAPGDHHMRVARDSHRLTVHLDQGPRVNSCRPSVDPLFSAAAELRGTRVLGIMLTGMGQDGLEGARRIREAGGMVVAQDEASSAVWGMPGAVVRAGLHHAILDPGQISDLLSRVLFSSTSPV